MNYLWWIPIAFCLIYVLWIHYLAVMSLSRAKKAGLLSRTALSLGLPVLWIGLVLDFIANTMIFTIILLELPREMTVSHRITRHIVHGAGWRQSACLAIAASLLDAFDPAGKHRVGA